MSKWVQHRSGQGEKWEVVKEWSDGLNVRKVEDGVVYHVPADEYVECPPPKTWVDVTAECDWGNAGNEMEATIYHDGLCLLADRGYRLRKVKLFREHPNSNQNCTQHAFIVERRHP